MAGDSACPIKLLEELLRYYCMHLQCRCPIEATILSSTLEETVVSLHSPFCKSFLEMIPPHEQLHPWLS
jgi:hypothetical protein